MQAEPRAEHRWLQQLVGEWTIESECSMGPDQPGSKMTGREIVRPLGELWVIGEGACDTTDCGPMRTVITLGYDPTKQQFVGTFIASIMTYLWIYDGGALDATGRILTLPAEGPSFSPEGGLASYRDAIEIVSKDHRVMTSQLLGADGKWTQFMTAHYRRQV